MNYFSDDLMSIICLFECKERSHESISAPFVTERKLSEYSLKLNPSEIEQKK